MSTTTLKNRLVRAAAALVAATLVATPALIASSAEAKRPDGSKAEVILETKQVTGQPWYASLRGWWGHEGARTDTRTAPTYVSLDVTDGHGLISDASTSALHKALDDGGDFSNMRVAFVPASADGSNERPKVTQGENAGQAFTWFGDLGVGSALNGTTNKNDGVAWVSTLGEYTKWWQAGRPVQGFTDQLNVIDIADGGGTHPSAAPQGRSILDRWPAGTKISLVFYVSDGYDKQMPQVPTVKVGPDRRALTAWMTFETVASPTHPARTSGGYRVLTGAGTGPGVAARPQKSTAGGQDANGQAAGNQDGDAAAAGSSSGSGKGSGPGTAAGKDTGLERLTSGLPGGQPTFWVLLVLLVAGAGAWATARMRTSSIPPDQV